MKYTQLLVDKTKEELAMLCMDKHRQIKRLTEANAKLRAMLARAGDPDVVDEMLDATGTYCPPEETT